MILKENLFL